MANKKEVSVQVNIGANLEDFQKKLTGPQSRLNKLGLPASVKDEFVGLFSAMDRELEKISQKTAGGKLKLIDSSSVGKSIERIDSLYSALIQKFESRGIATTALKQDQLAISAITNALKVYASSTKSILSEEKKLTAEVQKQERAKEALLEKQKEQKVVSDAELAAQKEKVSAATKEANMKAKAVTVAREALEKKIAESGGKYKISDIGETGSALRKTKAYRDYKAATEASGIANKTKKMEAENLASMTTLEQQKKDIQEIELRITKAKDKLHEFNETQKVAKEIEAFEEIKKQLIELGNIDFSKYGINLEEIQNIDQLQQALEKVKLAAKETADTFGKEYSQEMKDAGTSVNKLEKNVKNAVESVEELDDRTGRINAMQERIKSFLGISGAAQVMRAALRDAMQTITELDATMTEMAVVTDLSVGDYWNQLPQYSKQASDLGVSINSAYKAATLYYQQGLKSNEVTKISAETLKMARIAGLSAEDATNKMTAALRGFNMELNEISAQRVSDVYSELAAITASDVDEISSAMTKTASIASSAGMEFETTAAFLSQIIETTRESAETAGTALKTVIARFQELKKAPGEIGEVEGEIVDANKIETALRSVGVALRDSSGQFRDLDDVFLELSRKWDTLDTNTQRYIATIAAGSRQQSRFIAMMSDYSRTQQLVTAANNSAGASNEQFEKTLDSLESKIEKLKNAWHEFTMGILESDLVKFGVEMLTKFLEIINKATSQLSGLGNSITKIMGVFAIFKMGQKLFEQFKGPLLNFFVDVTEESYKGGVNSMRAFKQGVEDEKNNIQSDRQGEPNIKGMKMKEAFAFSSQKRAENELLRQEIKNDREFLTGEYHSYENAKNRVKFGNTDLEVVDQEIASLEREEADYLSKNNITKNEKGQYTKKGKKALSKKDQEFLRGNADKRTKKISEKSSIEEQINKDTKAVEEYEKIREDLGKKEEQINKNSKDSWEAIGQGIGQAGQGIAAVGSVMSLLGGLLSSLGLEELGDALSGIGQVITIIGGALMAIPPILTLISAHPIIAIITIALGVILALIVAIVSEMKKNSPEGKLKAVQEAAEAAADAADRATESYENLTSAIDSLSDKYEAIEELTRGTSEWNKAVQEVNQEVMDLIEKYPELTEFLSSKSGVLVLDLDDEKLQNIIIEAQTVSVTAQNTASIASGEAAKLQSEANMNSYTKRVIDRTFKEVTAKSHQGIVDDLWGDVQSIDILDVVGYIAKTIWNGRGSPQGIGGAILSDLTALWRNTAWDTIQGLQTAWQESQDTKEILDLLEGNFENVARAMADGIIIENQEGEYEIVKGQETLANELGITSEYLSKISPTLKDFGGDIKTLGKMFLDGEELQENGFRVAAENTKLLINLSDRFDDKEEENKAWDYIDQLLTKDVYKTLYNEEFKNIQEKGLGEEQKKYIIRTLYGSDAEWDEGSGKVTDLNGNTIAKVTLNQLISHEANNRVNERLKEAGESAYGAVETVKQFSNDSYISDTTIERMFSDSAGGLLTQKDLTQIANSGMIESAWFYWENFTDEQKDLFGRDGNKFIEYLKGVVNDANKSFSSAAELLTGRGITRTNFSSVNAKTAHELAKIATSEEMTDGEAADFLVRFNDIIANNNLTEDQRAHFSQLVAAMSQDPTNRENWEKIVNTLQQSGIDISSTIGQEISEFISWSAEATSARYSDAFLGSIDVSEELISHYRNAEGKELESFHKTFSDWEKDYKVANSKVAKIEHELVGKVVSALVSGYEKQIDAQEEISNAITEANDKMLSLLSKGIEESRQRKENEQTEQDLTDQRSRLAYLSQDTSGANSLEILELQKEIDEAEADYQTSLVDQALTKLEDANEHAAEQRERQIEIARDQLEAYTKSEALITAAQTIVDDAVAKLATGKDIKDTELGKLLAPEHPISEYEEDVFWTELRSQVGTLVQGENPIPPEDDGPDPDENKRSLAGYINKYIDYGKHSDKSGSTLSTLYASLLREVRENNLTSEFDASEMNYEWFVNLIYGSGIFKYATGGLADFTGPAWLDGTPSKPEYILNAKQTERFFSLIDVLEAFNLEEDTTKKNERNGDNYFDIEINVEKLESDYDVEKIANKIRSMIYEDASYRNVNTINLIR